MARCALVVVPAVCALSALAALGTFASVASLICLPVREFDLILSPVTPPLVRRLPGIEPFLMDDPLMSLPILVAAPCASDVPLTANASATRATPIAGETRIALREHPSSFVHAPLGPMRAYRRASRAA